MKDEGTAQHKENITERAVQDGAQGLNARLNDGRKEDLD